MIPCPQCGVANEGVSQPCAACAAPFEVAGVRIDEHFADGQRVRVYLGSCDSYPGVVSLELPMPSLADDPAFREAFLQEADRLVTRLRDVPVDEPLPLARILDAGETALAGEPRLFVVREWLSGEALSSREKRGLRLAPEDVLAVGAAAARALQALHDAEVVHGDVRSSSILLPEAGTSSHVAVVADAFPAGHRLAPEELETQSPERVAGDRPTPASDQYSLAVVLYRALTGHLPGERSGAPRESETVAAHLLLSDEERDEAVQELAEPLRDGFRRALDRDPERRHARLADLAEVLEGVDLGAPVETSGASDAAGEHLSAPRDASGEAPVEVRRTPTRSLPPPPAPATARPASLLLLLAGIVVVVAGVLAVALRPGGPIRKSEAVIGARLAIEPRLQASYQLRDRLGRAGAALPDSLFAELKPRLREEERGHDDQIADWRDRLAQLVEANDAEGIVALQQEIDRLHAALEPRLVALDDLVRAGRAQLAGVVSAAGIKSRLGEARTNANEILDLAGGGFDLVLQDLTETGEDLRAVRALDESTSSRAPELREVAERTEEILQDIHARILEACERFDSAQRELPHVLDALATQSLRAYEEAEHLGELPAVEAWLEEKNTRRDELEVDVLQAERSREAMAGLEELRALVGEVTRRARELEVERLRREREALLARVEAMLPSMRDLLAEAKTLDLVTSMEPPCGQTVTEFEEQLARYDDPAAARVATTDAESLHDDDLHVLAAAALERGEEAARECLVALFHRTAERQKRALESLLADADDGSEHFDRVRQAYEETVREARLEENPLPVIRAFQAVEFSVYSHLKLMAARVQIDLTGLRGEADLRPEVLEPLPGFATELEALQVQLDEPQPDLVQLSLSFRQLASRTTALRRRVENERRRLDAERLKTQALEMEQKLVDAYYGKSLRPSEQEIYQRAVRILGEGKDMLEAGDYTGAKASFEYSIEQFQNIRR